MRLRNIPRADGVLNESEMVIKNASEMKGCWNEKIFENKHPIHIEIGMGKGQFLLELAKRTPHINYIGIERYSSVLLRAVEKLDAIRDAGTSDNITIKSLFPNIRFLCIDAAEIPDIFAPEEVERIYLNFSDPWPKARHARRRLTSSEYFARYDKILARDGQVEFKTDNRGLFDFSVEEINASEIWELTACTYDLHNDPSMNEGNIMTEYETKFSSMNHPICKLIAGRKNA